MTTVHVKTGRSYDVLIGKGLLSELGARVRTLLPKTRTVAVVTDETVAALYLKPVSDTLAQAGLQSSDHIIPPGEGSKTGTQYLSLLNRLAERRVTRTDCILALGGGVVGDLAGFAAATYLRGIPYIQVPTTLLAMVDSSVGGKTAIDLPAGKNLAGAFRQPALVVADVDTLDSLPEAVFSEGMGEVIKYGMLASAGILDQLLNDNLSGEGALSGLIAACVAIKRDIVERDEFDTACRQLLNLGHTIGHAIEQLEGYAIPHGHAVAIGMVLETRAAVKKGLCPPQCLTVLESLLERCKLPGRTKHGAKAIFEAALSDKKRTGEQITIVAPRALGKSELLTIPLSELYDWIELGVTP